MQQLVAVLTVLLLPWQTVWLLSPVVFGVGSSFMTLSIYLVDVLLFVCCLLLLRRTTFSFARPAQERWLFGIAFIALFIGTFLSPVPILAVQKFVSFFLVGFFTWFAIRILPRNLIFVTVSVAGVVAAVLGIGQFLLQTIPGSSILGIASQSASILGTAVVETVQERFLRAYGPFPHPNILGGYLALTLVFTVAYYFQLYEKFQPWWNTIGQTVSKKKLWHQPIVRQTALAAAFSLATFVLLITGLLVSFSRSAMLGAVVGVGSFLNKKIHQNPIRGGVLSGKLFLIACLTITVWVLSVPGLFQGRLTASGRLEAYSVASRLTQYKEANTLFMSNALFGVGVGNYVPALMQTFPGRAVYDYEPVHNVLVLAVVEVGAIGSLAVLLLLYRKREMLRQLLLTPTGAGVMYTLLPLMLLDHYIWSLHAGIVLLVLVGLGLSSKETVS